MNVNYCYNKFDIASLEEFKQDIKKNNHTLCCIKYIIYMYEYI